MPLEISIPDEDLVGFSEPAKNHLKNSIESFCASLVTEANRLEAAGNITNGAREITAAMVNDASMIKNRGLSRPKPAKKTVAAKILSAILPFSVGIMYDSTKLQENSYLVMFILLIAAAIFAVTFSVLSEN